jgi:hypothetical protein
MNNNLKITCPKCKATFDAGDAFNAHFENAQIENEKKLKDVTKKAQQEAENKFKLQFEKQQEEIKKIKKAESKKANEEAEKKYKAQLENKDKQLAEVQKNLEHKLKEESEKKLELAKKEAIKKAEELAGKKFQVLIDKQKEELEKSKKSEEILKKRVDERTQEISQIMQNRKVELQGEIQEERLQDFLRRKFPEDTVEEIKKGAKGGDCILSINHKGKKNIAKIYFESKDTKNFSEAWVDKLLSDMKDKGIANGIIVVSKSALPSDFDETSSFVQRHSNSIKIIPMELDIIHAIVDGIRSILILKSREDNDHEIPDLMKKCWVNLNSPHFILPIKTMVGQIQIMENQFKKEKVSFDRNSAIKDSTIREIKENLFAMVHSFTRNVGDILPQDLLEHKDDKYLE